jgi:hypothetical protein
MRTPSYKLEKIPMVSLTIVKYLPHNKGVD